MLNCLRNRIFRYLYIELLTHRRFVNICMHAINPQNFFLNIDAVYVIFISFSCLWGIPQKAGWFLAIFLSLSFIPRICIPVIKLNHPSYLLFDNIDFLFVILM